MAETLSTLSVVSYVVAATAVLLAIILWFSFKIPRVIGSLSGRTARKQIAKMRATNEKSGSKSYRPSTENVARGKITGTIPQKTSGNTTEMLPNMQKTNAETGLLTENRANRSVSAATELLDASAAPNSADYEGATDTLRSVQAATARRNTSGKTLKILDEIILVHTDEVIQ